LSALRADARSGLRRRARLVLLALASLASGRRKRTRFALVAALVAFAAAAVAAPPFSEGRLWRISKPGLGESFVFATIHVADARVSAIPKPVEDVLARARTLAMELAPVAIADEELGDLEQLEGGGRLEPLIGADAYAVLRARLRAGGVPERTIERLKPWAAMLKIAHVEPRGDERSLDERLFAQAQARRMHVTSLELLRETVAAFDAIPAASQVALLKHVLVEHDSLIATIEPTIDAWRQGDLAWLARAAERADAQYPGMGEHYRQIAKHVIDDRTVVMHHRLFMPLREGRVLVAIGAAHLYGERGLLAMLQRDGYRVTRIW
jgi:uncharacterized protein